jgi:hypothetical protein
MSEPAEVPPDVLRRLRAACLALPEVVEEEAWVGARWRVRTRTFAHVLMVDAGWPPAYARAVSSDGPACVLAFRSEGAELDALRNAGPPFFAPPWRADEVLVVLGDDVDWDEIAELLTESYRRQAPPALRARLERPPG